jgi:hypothetical protein
MALLWFTRLFPQTSARLPGAPQGGSPLPFLYRCCIPHQTLTDKIILCQRACRVLHKAVKRAARVRKASASPPPPAKRKDTATLEVFLGNPNYPPPQATR